MNVITDPLFYVLAVPLVLLFGMGKGGLGPGLGTLAVPVLSFVISPLKAAAIILPILCGADIFAVYHFRRHFDTHHLKILIPAGIVGICLAAIFMSQLNQNATRILIGVIALVFCLDHWLRPAISELRVIGQWGGFFGDRWPVLPALRFTRGQHPYPSICILKNWRRSY